jgi:hypothetical protein
VEVIATDAAAAHDSVAGDAWGGHQSRVVRNSSGDVYVVYVAESGSVGALEWRVMARGRDGRWSRIGQGSAGREPAHLLLGPRDELYVVAFPDDGPTLSTGRRSRAGRITWTQERVPGDWVRAQRAYGAAGIGPTGRICILRSQSEGNGSHARQATACRLYGESHWSTREIASDRRYCYDYVLPDANSLEWVATRDVQWHELGYRRPSGEPAYVLNAIGVWTTSYAGEARMVPVTEEPQTDTDSLVMTFVRDAYRDTHGRLHVLYELRGRRGEPGGWAMRHAIVADNRVIADTTLTARAPNGWTDGYFRMLQDSSDRLVWIYSLGADIYYYREVGSSGTTFDSPIHLSVRQYPVDPPGISVAAPRGGVRARATDNIDAIYPSGRTIVYLRLRT